jgi:hypothetical protein
VVSNAVHVARLTTGEETEELAPKETAQELGANGARKRAENMLPSGAPRLSARPLRRGGKSLPRHVAGDSAVSTTLDHGGVVVLNVLQFAEFACPLPGAELAGRV